MPYYTEKLRLKEKTISIQQKCKIERCKQNKCMASSSLQVCWTALGLLSSPVSCIWDSLHIG
jgi:hypothetical protein